MKRQSVFVDYALIILGAFIMGFAIKNLYDPINLVTGGVTGIAIVMKSVAGVPLWLTNTLCNMEAKRMAFYQADFGCHGGAVRLTFGDPGDGVFD